MSRSEIETIKKIFKDRRTGTVGSHGFYSVLVPLVEREEGLCLLYEVRAKDMKRQPGEICFPGGRMEKGETKEECAVRETKEELGIEEKSIEVISKLDTLHTYSDFTMFCYLGYVDDKKININKAEVEEVFTVPVKYLIENMPFIYEAEVKPDIGEDFPYEKINFPKGYRWRTGKAQIPLIEYGEKVIWGLTGRITDNFIKILKEEIKWDTR